MGDRSKIEWTNATWNPVTGCIKVSPGCAHCYAERQFPRVYGNRPFSQVLMHPDRLEQPLRWKRPRMIFVNSMSDLFHENVLDDFIDQVFAVMALAQQHTFQVLTKRPEGMNRWFQATGRDGVEVTMFYSRFDQWRGSYKRYGTWPLPNVWLGVSVENQHFADARIPLLLETPAAVRFLSCEPLLGPVDLRPYMPNALWNDLPSWKQPELDWVIAGGESGPRARPMDPAWARWIRDQCTAAGVPFFFKQWGGVHKKQAGRVLDGRTWDEMPQQTT